MEQQQLRFPGFPEKPKENYWQYPEIMNGFWHSLTPVEQKILDYILRHTWGWHKNSDYLSYGTIKNGILNIDKGTGIKSDKTLRKGLKGLEEKNMIRIYSGKMKGIANCYSLVLNEGVGQDVKTPPVKSKEGGRVKSKDTINNTINTITINKEINDLIDLFKRVNPSYERLFANKTQRSALERLYEKLGKEKLEQILIILPKTNQMKYAPIICTPAQLEDKIGLLMAFIQKERNQESKVIKI